MTDKKHTSWENSSQWYHGIVGKEGHYYHQKIILPGVLRLLNLQPGNSILDIGCGQGILARHIPKQVNYTGIDLSKTFIETAKKDLPFHFQHADATKKLPIEKNDFSHAIAILSLQNMEHPDRALKNMADHLQANGKAIFVLNHPCFRIPRQTSWGYDEEQKIQYRRIDRYASPLKIPILMHPGQKDSEKTWSFHFSLSWWFQACHQAGFVIEITEEWVSDKVSEGGRAKAENFAREEFPLFFTAILRKLP